MTCKVLICDDEPDIAKGWLENISKVVPDGAYELLPVPSNERIKDAILVLLRRRAALRERKDDPGEECLFDQADVLVLDYDLLHVDEMNTRYTGEGLARLARAFSRCGVLVVLNQYQEGQFDLGMRGHMESFADLNIDGEVIGYEGLWCDPPWKDFRPWHWPVLVDASERFQRRVAFLADGENMKLPVARVLGITAERATRLSDTAFGYLAPEASTYEEFAKTTFAEFVGGNSAAVDTRDGAAIVERDPAAAARIAASRLAKWLDREILGAQDVLVDVPHLVQRAPYLLHGDLGELDVWNATIDGTRNRVRDMVPHEAWFSTADWLSKPALWWSEVEQAQAVRDARAKFDFASAPDFVFLEDASRFGTLAEAKEFRAGFHNSFDRRFVRNFQDIRYAPQRRFAFGG